MFQENSLFTCGRISNRLPNQFGVGLAAPHLEPEIDKLGPSTKRTILRLRSTISEQIQHPQGQTVLGRRRFASTRSYEKRHRIANTAPAQRQTSRMKCDRNVIALSRYLSSFRIAAKTNIKIEIIVPRKPLAATSHQLEAKFGYHQSIRLVHCPNRLLLSEYQLLE